MSVMHRWSLRARIGAALVVLTTVAAVATAAVYHRVLVGELSVLERSQLEHEAEIAALDWALRWESLANNASFVAQTPPIAGLSRALAGGGFDPADGSTTAQWEARLQTIFRSMMSSHPEYRQMRLIGFADGGRELVRVDRSAEGGRVTSVGASDLQRKGTEPYVRRAMRLAESGHPGGVAFFSSITLNREGGVIVEPHEPVVRAMALATDDAGDPYGIVVINTELSSVFEAQRSDLPDGRRYVVTNGQGQRLFDSDGTAGFAFEWGTDAGMTEGSVALRRALGEVATDLTRASADPVEAARAVALPGPSEDGLAVLIQPGRADVADVASSSLRMAAPPLAMVVLLTLFVGLVLGGQATRPFVELSASIARAGDEHVDPLPVPDSPEAALVADAFNRSRARLTATLEELRRRNRDLDQFVTMASHDLQEPARAVRSFSGIFRKEYAHVLDEEGREMAAHLVAASERMQRLLRDLLEHNRIGRSPEHGSVDCGALVAHVERLLATEISESGATVSHSGLPRVEGVERDLRLLFQHLVGNALKFRRPGVPPAVTITARFKPSAGEHHFTVADNGRGIDPAVRHKVFQLFRRGHADAGFDGTGIGLAHCQKIVEGHGGRIWIGDADEGAEIHFTLRSDPRQRVTGEVRAALRAEQLAAVI